MAGVFGVLRASVMTTFMVVLGAFVLASSAALPGVNWMEGVMSTKTLTRAAHARVRADGDNDVHWRQQGACIGVDPELFFDDNPKSDETLAAKAVCAGCPVLERCRDWAMMNGVVGVWAGMTDGERAASKRSWLDEQGVKGVAALRRMHEVNARPSADARLGRRLENAKLARSRLLELHAREGVARFDNYRTVLELIIANPVARARDLAARIDKSAAWFNTAKREVFDLVGVDNT